MTLIIDQTFNVFPAQITGETPVGVEQIHRNSQTQRSLNVDDVWDAIFEDKLHRAQNNIIGERVPAWSHCGYQGISDKAISSWASLSWRNGEKWEIGVMEKV